MGDVDAINQQRLEKDTKELQKLIESHFVQRTAEDEEFNKFKDHLDERKERRANEITQKQEKEKAKREAEAAEAKEREAEEDRKKAEKEENKALAFVPDKNRYKRQPAENNWNSKISELYRNMSFC